MGTPQKVPIHLKNLSFSRSFLTSAPVHASQNDLRDWGLRFPRIKDCEGPDRKVRGLEVQGFRI